MRHVLSFIFLLSSSIVVLSQLPGQFDPSFHIGTAANTNIQELLLQPDGKIIAAGGFTVYDGVNRQEIIRLNPSGFYDPTFNSGTGVDGAYSLIMGIALQNDGKIIIGGSFESYNDVPSKHLARLHSTGELDTSFHVGIGADLQINDLVIQPDQKVIICGYFTTYNGIPSHGIARLNQDGSYDTSFHVGTGTPGGWGPHHISLQTDGKILLSGRFDEYSGVPSNTIVRILPNGLSDPSFSMGTGVQGGGIECAIAQPDGKILIGGYFTSYGGFENRGMARLMPDGSLDTSFQTGYGNGFTIDRIIHDIDVQDDGKIIFSGYFTTFNGVAQNNLIRLLPDGTKDPNFHVGSGPNWPVHCCLIDEDKLYISGQFDEYNGFSARRLARLYGGTDYTGLDEVLNIENISLFPNPTNIGSFHIQNNISESSVHVVNNFGQIIAKYNSNEQSFDLPLSISAGVYSVWIFSGDDLICKKLIVK